MTEENGVAPHPQPTKPPVKILGFWTPRFYYGWIILAVVFLAEFSSTGMGGITLALFFPVMGEEMGWSLTKLTGAVTAQGIAALVI